MRKVRAFPDLSQKPEASVTGSGIHWVGFYKKGHMSWSSDPWTLVGEGGVIPLQLGLPGASLPMSDSAHPFLVFLFAVIRATAAGAHAFLFFLSVSLVFPMPWSFVFLDTKESKEVCIKDSAEATRELRAANTTESWDSFHLELNPSPCPEIGSL